MYMQTTSMMYRPIFVARYMAEDWEKREGFWVDNGNNEIEKTNYWKEMHVCHGELLSDARQRTKKNMFPPFLVFPVPIFGASFRSTVQIWGWTWDGLLLRPGNPAILEAPLFGSL